MWHSPHDSTKWSYVLPLLRLNASVLSHASVPNWYPNRWSDSVNSETPNLAFNLGTRVQRNEVRKTDDLAVKEALQMPNLSLNPP